MQDRLSPFPPLQSQKAQEQGKLKPAALFCDMLQNVIESQKVSLPSPPHQAELFVSNSRVVAALPTSPKAKQLCHKRRILFTQKKIV